MTRGMRAAVACIVAGVVMTVAALLAGDRSLAVTWDAVRSVASVASMAWLWAATPRFHLEELAA